MPSPTLPTARDGLGPIAALVAVAIAVFVLGTAPARGSNGQTPIDVNRFHPAPGSGHILTLELADVGRPYELVPQLILHFADLPFAYTFGDRIQSNLVANRLTADLSVSLSLWRRVRLSVALPVTLFQQGSAVSYTDPSSGLASTLPAAASAGQEDLRIGLKLRLVSDPAFGLGLVAEAVLPSARPDGYLGSSGVNGTAKLVGHYIGERLTVAINAGVRWAVADDVLLDVRSGNALYYGLGAQVEFYKYRGVPFYLLAEVYGLAPFNFDKVVNSPAELMLAFKTRVNDVTLLLGAGPGLDRGFGEPNVRVLAGVSYAWTPSAKPAPVSPPAPRPPPPPPPPPPPGLPTVVLPTRGDRLELGQQVHFDFDRDTIKPVSYPLLDEVGVMLRQHRELGSIRIDGHTDDVGGEEYNVDLARRRARSVFDYLVLHGVPASRLTSAGYGKRCPLVSNQTDDGRATNRRVDFILLNRELHHPAAGECPAVPAARERSKP